MNSNNSNELKDNEKKSNGKKSSIGILVSLVVLIATFVGVCFISKNYNSNSLNKKSEVSKDAKLDIKNKDNKKEEVEGNKKNIIVTVIDKNKNEKKYEHSTDAEFLRQALEEIDGLKVEGEESNTGLYVKKVNGVTADYNVDQSYWAFYINDEYCQNGVDTQKVTDGDSFKIVYTKN